MIKVIILFRSCFARLGALLSPCIAPLKYVELYVERGLSFREDNQIIRSAQNGNYLDVGTKATE